MMMVMMMLMICLFLARHGGREKMETTPVTNLLLFALCKYDGPMVRSAHMSLDVAGLQVWTGRNLMTYFVVHRNLTPR